MMMVLISFIFIVVAVNIFHAMKRSVVERIEEIALMKAVGATGGEIQFIFITEGLIIGILGSFIGVLSAYTISHNVNGIFHFVERLVLFFIDLFSRFTRGRETMNGDGIYRGTLYFFQELPVEIMSSDVLYVTATALFSVLAAAWCASRAVSTIRPAKVLRYE